jgi:hypothetical protein
VIIRLEVAFNVSNINKYEGVIMTKIKNKLFSVVAVAVLVLASSSAFANTGW